MSPSDEAMLHDFLGQLVQARDVRKDPEAEALIRRAIEQQPDAAYLLVQRCLLAEQALDTAKGRIAMLENQLLHGQAPAASGAPTHQASYQHAMPGSMSGASAFQRGNGVMGAAAGVAAGSFLYHGLDNFLPDNADPPQKLLDSGEAGIEGNHGFFDGDGSDEGLFG